MSNKKFAIKLNLVIIGTDIPINKQYILSAKFDDIELPFLYLDSQSIADIEQRVVEYAQSLVFTNELELTPQLISLNNKFIDSAKNELNVVYGFVIKKIDNIDKSYWIEFDYMNSNKYSNLLFEVIQKLK
jgi:hypothetical protein